MHLIYICSRDGQRMELAQGKYGLFYRCPNHLYPSEEKRLHRKSCSGRLTLRAAQRIEQLVKEAIELDQLESIINGNMVIHMDSCNIRFHKRSNQICEVLVERVKNQRLEE